MVDHIRTSSWICGGPFPRGRQTPYDVVIACAERVGRGDAGSQHLSLRQRPVKKPTDAGQPGAQGDGPDPPDPPDHPDPPDRKTAGSRADLQQRLRGLKPGHPSSPYNGDGSRKPDPVPLSELESASDADGHDSNPADQDADHADQADRAENAEHAEGRASEGWRAALPRLQGLWERHEERWPAEQQSPVDRSKDAPGSWRGDGGQYLSSEENLLAEHELDRVRQAEPEISKTMQAIEAEVPNARLVGLQYCLKGADRFKEKVQEDHEAMPSRSVDEIARQIPDAVRYTYQLETSRYVDGYWDLCERVKQQGNEMVSSRNFWSSTQYKGINTRWRAASGQLFEIQAHTQESFEAKQLTHGAYERIRSSPPDGAERLELYAFQADVSTKVPVPDGAHSIPDYYEDERKRYGREIHVLRDH
jgi:hypothetical protein